MKRKGVDSWHGKCFASAVMKKTTTILTISGSLLAGGFAQAEVESSFNLGYNSDYVYRGFDLGTNAFQYGFDLSGEGYCGFSWSAGIWYITPEGDGFSDELDIYAGVSRDFGAINVAAGFTNYSYPNSGADDDNEVYVGVATSAYGLDVGFTVYYGWGGILEEQVLLEGTLGYGFDLTDKIGANIGATVGYVASEGEGGYASEDGFAYLNATIGLSYALSDSITIDPYITYTDGDDIIGPGNYSGVYGGVIFNYSF